MAFVFLYTDVTFGFNMSLGNFRRFSQNPSIIVQVTDKKKKEKGDGKKTKKKTTTTVVKTQCLIVVCKLQH